jgi:hypothetical protein
MTPTKKIWVTITVTVVVTLLAAFIALFAAGAGHGTYLPAGLLFPFGTLYAMTSKHAYEGFGLVLVLSQFPIYAVIVCRAWLRGNSMIPAFAISLVHAITAIALVFWMQR